MMYFSKMTVEQGPIRWRSERVSKCDDNNMPLGNKHLRRVYYTWTNRSMGTQHKESKIVRAFTNDAWAMQWPNVVCQIYNEGSNNHLTLVVKLRQMEKINCTFRSLNSWLADEEYNTLASNI